MVSKVGKGNISPFSNQNKKEKEENKMEKIYEFIALIPEEFGWSLVGALAMLCVVMIYNIIKMIIDGQRDEEEI